MNEIITKRNELQTLIDAEYYPVQSTDITSKMKKMPLAEITSLGTAFSSIAEPFRTVTTTSTTDATGYWKLVSDTKLFQGKDGFYQGVERQIVSGKGNKAITEFARFEKGSPLTTTTTTTLPINPAMICIAIAIANIDKKLSVIQEAQEELIERIEAQERAEIRSNLLFLEEVTQAYKYNIHNERFINANYGQILEIKRESSAKVIEYSELIQNAIKKQKTLHVDADVKKIGNKISKLYNEYQIALYVYSYASFVEVMFNQQFESSHLDDIIDRMEYHLNEFTHSIEQSISLLDDYYETTFGNQMLDVFSLVGNVVKKTPVINKSAIGELIDDGTDFLRDTYDDWKQNILAPLMKNKETLSVPFVEGVKRINSMNAQQLEFITDGTDLFYLDPVEE